MKFSPTTKTTPIKIYNNGVGIYEVLEQMRQQVSQALIEEEIKSNVSSTGLYIHLRSRASNKNKNTQS